MQIKNKFIGSIEELRTLLDTTNEKEVWVYITRKSYSNNEALAYVEVVKVALCYGWIDSTLKREDSKLWQRLSPRRKGSHWTELNIQRCKDLIEKGLMTQKGIDVMP